MDETALHEAASRGDVAAVRQLLDAGADPNAVGERGCTPLHRALERQRLQVARMLIAAGASLDARNGDGVSCREIGGAMSLWEPAG